MEEVGSMWHSYRHLASLCLSLLKDVHIFATVIEITSSRCCTHVLGGSGFNVAFISSYPPSLPLLVWASLSITAARAWHMSP